MVLCNVPEGSTKKRFYFAIVLILCIIISGICEGETVSFSFTLISIMSFSFFIGMCAMKESILSEYKEGEENGNKRQYAKGDKRAIKKNAVRTMPKK